MKAFGCRLSRRSFLEGAVSFGALGCCGVLRGEDRGAGTPRLTFGVVSDIHFAADRNGLLGGPSHAETFEKALTWFREQGVDAVVCCGDMADRSLDTELQAVADTWFRVFPDDKAPDGRTVARVFVTGNHDWEGHRYGVAVKNLYPDEAERTKHVIREDLPGWWRKCFREDYKAMFRKDVKGYSFLCCQWEGVSAYTGFGKFLKTEKAALDPRRPFFVIQHPHPLGTCYGIAKPNACTDYGKTTEALKGTPNAVVFSGHSHYPLTDERAIWQGDFTSVAAASLRYGSTSSRPGCENGLSAGKDGWKEDAEKLSPDECGNATTVRQGLLVTVYDDRIVYRRRDFLNGLSLGPDWIQPLGVSAGTPYAFDEHARTCGVPAFAADARLVVTREKAANRGGRNPANGEQIKSVEREVYAVTIPPASGNPAGRAMFYDVTAESAGVKRTKRLYATGYNRALETPKAKKPTCCRFSVSDFSGRVTFTVRPVNSLDVAGAPLVASFGE